MTLVVGDNEWPLPVPIVAENGKWYLDGAAGADEIVYRRIGRNELAAMQVVLADLAPGLAKQGITIKSFYDRSELIDRTIDTLKHALIEEIVLVTLAHIIFLWHFRSILIVTLPLPLAVLASFLAMRYGGMSSNLMSGARILLECLTREGVDCMFGYPGGAVLPIYDALYDFEGLRHVLVRQLLVVPQQDHLAGLYHQPLIGQTFEVVFQRLKP